MCTGWYGNKGCGVVARNVNPGQRALRLVVRFNASTYECTVGRHSEGQEKELTRTSLTSEEEDAFGGTDWKAYLLESIDCEPDRPSTLPTHPSINSCTGIGPRVYEAD